ncbi:MAG: phage major capsid protein [Planctomycetes bacterium]|nr:phage major capsid protein [Planctomycetota bacterium]
MTEEEKQRRAEQIQAAEDKVRKMVDDKVITISESVAELAEQVKALNERHAKDDELARSRDVPGSGDMFESGEWSIGRVATSLIARANMDPNYRKYAEAEWEVSDAAQGDTTRAPSTSPNSKGGFVMPEEIRYGMLIEPYENLISPVALGATVMSGLTHERVKIPMILEEFEAESLSEHEKHTQDQDLNMGEVLMTPYTAQVITNPSREFLDGGVGADAMLQGLLGKAIARKMTYMGFAGSNSSSEPLGVLNLPNLQSVDFAAGNTPTTTAKPYHPNAYYNLLEMEGKLEDIDALDNEATSRWAIHPIVKRVMQGMKSENAAAGTESLEMDRKAIYDSGESSILGRGFVSTARGLKKGAQATAILGDWSEMYLGLWGNLMIDASTQTERAMRRREVMLSVYQRYTWAYGRPNWFVAAKNWNLTQAAAA